MDALKKSLLVFVGAGLGANARYWLGGWVQAKAGPDFPWGTLIVNGSGSLLIGAFLAMLERSSWPSEVRLLVAIGFLGGYTTFSTFSYETVQMIREGSWTAALWNVVATNVLCLVGCWIGFSGTRSVIG